MIETSSSVEAGASTDGGREKGKFLKHKIRS